MSLTIEQEILLERYRYVLSRKRDLNEGTFKILTVYQAGLAALITGFCILQYMLDEVRISEKIYHLAAKSSVLLLWILTLWAVSMILSGVLSWFNYRVEECDLERSLGLSYATSPTMKGLFRWYESYLVLFLLILAMLGTLVVHSV